MAFTVLPGAGPGRPGRKSRPFCTAGTSRVQLPGTGAVLSYAAPARRIGVAESGHCRTRFRLVTTQDDSSRHLGSGACHMRAVIRRRSSLAALPFLDPVARH